MVSCPCISTSMNDSRTYICYLHRRRRRNPNGRCLPSWWRLLRGSKKSRQPCRPLWCKCSSNHPTDQLPNTNVSPPVPRPGAPNFVAGSLVPTPAPGILPPNPALAAAAARLPITTASALPARPNLPDDPVIPINGFATHDEAEKAFVHLLKKAGVDPTWTWDATMRAIITDPLYKALGTLAEKKAAWQKVGPYPSPMFPFA